VERLEEASVELEARAKALTVELESTRRRVDHLRATVVVGEAQLDRDVRSLESLRGDVSLAEDMVSSLRVKADEFEAGDQDGPWRARIAAGRGGRLDIARATAETDLAHLASACVATVQASLDEVITESRISNATAT